MPWGILLVVLRVGIQTVNVSAFWGLGFWGKLAQQYPKGWEKP